MNRIYVLALASILLSACGGGGGPGQPSQQSTPPVTQPAPTPTPPPPPPPSEARPVFMGDSITERWTNLPGVNAGRNGDITAFMLARFQNDVLSRHPRVVVILGGTNDVLNFEFPDLGNLQRMADMAAAAGACVILGTLPPVYEGFGIRATAESTIAPISKWNSDVEMLAKAYGYKIADYHAALDGHPEFSDDKLHPNQQGYAVMLGVVQPLIDQCNAR